MKNTFKYIIALATASAIFSCNNSTADNNRKSFNELEKANWLIGEWQNSSPEGNATEIWAKQNDSTYSGKSYFISGKDTLSSETISLEQNGEELYYIPTVKDQNDGQAIKFIFTALTSKQLVFENPKHDFPQKISYTQITSDSLLAEISGAIDGKQESQKFQMTRIKKN